MVPTDQPGALLVQVLTADDYAVSNVLLGVPSQPVTNTPRLAYLPGSLLIDDPAGGAPLTLGLTPSEPDTLSAVTAIDQQFGLEINGGITLDRLAFAGLIDAVGGVWINVPERLFIPRTEGGLPLVVSRGWQRLDGITGTDYATLREPGRGEDAVLHRFSLVFTEVLRRLPVAPERLRQLFTNLGSLAASTTTTETLMSVFAQARDGVLLRTDTQVFVEVAVIRDGLSPASVVTERGSRTVATMFFDFRAEPTPVLTSPGATTQ